MPLCSEPLRWQPIGALSRLLPDGFLARNSYPLSILLMSK
jgi:hypothetical protein